MTDLAKVLVTFGISLTPVLELRAGIPAGVALGLSTTVSVVTAIVGSLVQVLAAVYLVDWAYRLAGNSTWIRYQLSKMEAQVDRHRRLIQIYGWMGLAAFVLVPLPGTGVWGGAVLSRLLQMPSGPFWLGMSLGISVSAVVMGAALQGGLELLSLF